MSSSVGFSVTMLYLQYPDSETLQSKQQDSRSVDQHEIRFPIRDFKASDQKGLMEVFIRFVYIMDVEYKVNRSLCTIALVSNNSAQCQLGKLLFHLPVCSQHDGCIPVHTFYNPLVRPIPTHQFSRWTYLGLALHINISTLQQI